MIEIFISMLNQIKIRNLTLEQINKNLLILAFLSLLFRFGSFAKSNIPKLFEIIFTLIVILTIVDLIKNRKIKEFFFSVPKNIRIIIFFLTSSILLGWAFATFFLKISLNFNMILEFGTFAISLGVFLLTIFYARNDKTYIKKCLYALLAPAIYIIFILFSHAAYYLKFAQDSTFLAYTENPSIISKMLLIPSIFFITHALFCFKKKLLKMMYIIISSALVALLFWVSSRGALVSLVAGSLFVWIIFSLHKFTLKRLLQAGVIIFLILLIGYSITPQGGKQQIVNKVLNPNDSNFIYTNLENQSTLVLYEKFINSKSNHNIIVDSSQETRFQFWSFYLKKVIRHPLGFGPNTHMNIEYKNGTYFNLGPHNTYIEILLWGGLVGLMSFLYLVFFTFKNLIIKLKSNFDPTALALAGMLFTLSIAIFFNDNLQFYWFWIVLAVALKYEKFNKS